MFASVVVIYWTVINDNWMVSHEFTLELSFLFCFAFVLNCCIKNKTIALYSNCYSDKRVEVQRLRSMGWWVTSVVI